MPRWNKKPDQRLVDGMRQFRIGVMLQTIRAVCEELLEEFGLPDQQPTPPAVKRRKRRRKAKRAA